jgi:uncharacterized cupin superfamily protein
MNLSTLVTDRGEVLLAPGMCAGFPAQGLAHQLVNRSNGNVISAARSNINTAFSIDGPDDNSTADQ